MPIATIEAEQGLTRLREIAQELANHNREAYLVVTRNNPKLQWQFGTPYAVAAADADEWERSNFEARVEPA